MSLFETRLSSLIERHRALITRPNQPDPAHDHGLYQRYLNPILTAQHTPLFWRYDLNPATNPALIERQGINAVFNPGAIEVDGRILLVCRVEGWDRKSFFAVAESKTGVDNFRFWDRPIVLDNTDDPDVNVYDMRLTLHEDGNIYGLFCTERRDPKAVPGDCSSAIAQCGIARTRDLVRWERLPDLRSRSPQQRNVVLHPEYVGGKYALYTRPQDDFISAGSGGGIGWALADAMASAVIGDEHIIDARAYHTIKEAKNGQGPPPLKTHEGWIHIAHGVRACAAGLRYVVYAFLTALDEPWRVIAAPAGYLIAPEGEERVGDVSNVVFCNGAVKRESGEILIYYASSDTRVHVATTTEECLLDYLKHTPADRGTSAGVVEERMALIERNLAGLSPELLGKVRG